MAVTNGREFLLAIKESTHTVFDEDAADFLDELRKFMTAELNKRALATDERDAIVFFEGMLRGVQVKLKGIAQRRKGELGGMGLLDETGEPKVPEA